MPESGADHEALDLLRPEWPAPTGVHAVCSTRIGGVSEAPYGSLNLGDHVGDEPGCVAANRTRFERALGAKPVRGRRHTACQRG